MSEILRGVFDDFENPEWQEAVESYPNQVPRFKSKEKCIAFTEQYIGTFSNPSDVKLRQSISTLTDWNQIEQYLLPKIDYYRCQPEILPDESSLENNKYFTSNSGSDGVSDSSPVHEYLLSRLNLPIHSLTTEVSVMNTLNYLFHTMRCGIYVMIKNSKLKIFCPFVNKDYKNNWNNSLKLSGTESIEEYYRKKNTEENFLPDMSKWWANGNIICSQYVSIEDDDTIGNQWWGDQFLFQLKDMIAETCNQREVPDCEFFVNKRDYPQLKYNKSLGPVEPYGFIFDKDDTDETQDIPLEVQNFKSYAPILSFYSSDRFADIPFPPSEDWEAATGEIFPPSFVPTRSKDKKLIAKNPRDFFTFSNLKKFEFPWSEKLPTAFFRGTATGGGVTVETNQRLHVASLSDKWSRGDASYLDAKLTGWNLRDKKIFSSSMTSINKVDFPFTVGAENFTPIYEQSKYKYILYIEGHCAACRYGFMMRLGSVILKVDSKCVADKMWYFPLLKPFYDHVPVKADLSDLKEKIEWCRAHDKECSQIAQNAAAVYDKYISREGILDYLQLVFYETAKRWHHLPDWARNPPKEKQAPKKKAFVGTTACCSASDNGLCIMCSALQKLDEEKLQSEKLAQNDSIRENTKKRNNGMETLRKRKQIKLDKVNLSKP